MPLVSVVIATRDRRPLLKEAIDSVFRLSFDDWELIVVDDASTDDTSDWLSTLEDRRLRSIRNGTPAERSACRNTGLAEAAGDLILFLDDDDRLTTNALGDLSRPLVQDPDVRACVGAFVAFDETATTRMHHPHRELVRSKLWREILFGWSCLPGRVLFRKDVLHSIGGWDQSVVYVEDVDLWLKVSAIGSVAFVPATVLEHRHHSGQWKPADALLTEERLRREFVKYRLHGSDQFRGSKILRARNFRIRSQASAGSSAWMGLLHLLKGVKNLGTLSFSPIVRRGLAGEVGKLALRVLLGKKISERVIAIVVGDRRMPDQRHLDVTDVSSSKRRS